MKRIGIDVGGTFTDVVVMDEESGRTTWFKTPTSYDDPSAGIMQAIRASTVPGPEMSHVKLGTTLALNAILTRTGAATGLLTTEGFRDVLQIRRTHRKRLFDLDETVPDPLVPRDLRLEIPERVDHRGNIVRSLDEDAVRVAWRSLRERGVTSLAIAFLFSFENPAHERRARDIVLNEGGAECVYLSSDVLPVHREYERTSTTVTAAYVAPVVRNYVASLSRELQDEGLEPGRLAVMTNSGGAMGAAAAGRSPVPTLLSGPAGGVTGTLWFARQAGLHNVLTLDMGGTSCDVSGIQDGVPDERLDMEIGGLDVAYPTFDIHTIGAGGGSIAWLDSGGALRVGPASAGSEPGPACYGNGGTQPTVTDANLVLGRYSPDHLLGGTLALDEAAARDAIDRTIATPMGLSVEQAAAGIVRIVNAHMANAVRTISVELGRDTRDFTLAAFGGAGPVHAADIAAELSIPRVLIPPLPGCTSAFGAALSRSRRDGLRSVNRPVDDVEALDLTTLVDGLHKQVVEELGEEGYDADEIDFEVWMNLHYRGQAHDLGVQHDGLTVTSTTLDRAVQHFHDLHAQAYGHAFDDVPVELVTLRVTGVGHSTDPDISWGFADQVPADDSLERRVWFEVIDDFTPAAVVDRAHLGPGEHVSGPAVVHQPDATVLVPPGAHAAALANGSLLITATTSDPEERP